LENVAPLCFAARRFAVDKAWKNQMKNLAYCIQLVKDGIAGVSNGRRKIIADWAKLISVSSIAFGLYQEHPLGLFMAAVFFVVFWLFAGE
jgi:hypothetical protein